MRNVMTSATEAELATLFHNARDGIPIRTALIEMGHPQAQTPIQTDNACATGIVNETVKQRRSKAIDMRFYWIRDRIKQGQYMVHWRKGADNLADYFTKHHSPAHHRHMRSQYLLTLPNLRSRSSQTTQIMREHTPLLRGCVDKCIQAPIKDTMCARACAHNVSLTNQC
jgi:hypothetical protein